MWHRHSAVTQQLAGRPTQLLSKLLFLSLQFSGLYILMKVILILWLLFTWHIYSTYHSAVVLVPA